MANVWVLSIYKTTYKEYYFNTMKIINFNKSKIWMSQTIQQLFEAYS